LGVVVPSVFADWKYKENITFTGGFGFILNDQSYEKVMDVFDPQESINDDMFIAWEIDLKAKIVLYDSMQILPYMAFFVPTDNFVYNTASNPLNFTEDSEPATDTQMKIGATVKYNF